MKLNTLYTVFVGFLFTIPSFAQQATVLELARCKQLALENNKQITKAKYQLAASSQGGDAARLAAYPMLDASLSGGYLGKPIGGAMNGLIPDKMANAMVSASVPLYTGGKIKDGITASKAQQHIAHQTVVMTERDILFETEKAYYEVVRLKEKETLAKEYITLLEALERDVNNSFTVGLIYKNDLLKVQVELTNARTGLKKVQDGRHMSLLALKQVIGIDEMESIDVSQKLQFSENMKVVSRDQRDGAISNRPEVQILEEVVNLEHLQAKVLKSAYHPTVAFSAIGLSGIGKGVDFTNGKNNITSYVGLLSVEMPLFDWGKRGTQAKQQKFKALAAQEDLDHTKEMLVLEVKNAEILVGQAFKDVRSSELALQQSVENQRIVQDRFDVGTIVSKDLLEANTLWQEAFSQLIDAKIVYLINTANLNRILGNR